MPDTQNVSVQPGERTRKRWKAAQLAGMLLFLLTLPMGLGFFVIVTIPMIGAIHGGWLSIIPAAGFFLFIGAKIGAWWEHG